jgi:hypothetical protein
MQTRIRTIKPEIAQHELLFDLERETGLPIRFAWTMLFTCCDREGRFEWRPRILKTLILPYDEGIDFERILELWTEQGLIVRYEVRGKTYGYIPTWTKHQVINNREYASKLPAPPASVQVASSQIEFSAVSETSTRAPRVNEIAPGPFAGTGTGTGTGTEGEGNASEHAHVSEHASQVKQPPPKFVSAQYDDEPKKKPRFTQSDFDARDLRKMNEAYQELARLQSAGVGGRGDSLSEKQVFEWVCQRSGITVVRGIELEALQRKWPDSGGMNAAH